MPTGISQSIGRISIMTLDRHFIMSSSGIMTIVVISGGAGKIIWIITLTFGSHQVIFLCIVIRLALNILDGVICGEASLPKIKELHLSIRKSNKSAQTDGE